MNDCTCSVIVFSCKTSVFFSTCEMLKKLGQSENVIVLQVVKKRSGTINMVRSPMVMTSTVAMCVPRR